MPAISIIIPTYNCSAYLPNCISSIVKQTFKDLEIIIVDDCSTDNTWLTATALAEADERIAVFRNTRNLGCVASRKNGALHSTGDYAMFLDPDDTLHEETCEKLMEEELRAPVDILHFGVSVQGVNDRARQAARDMAKFMNPKPRTLYGTDILNHLFTSDGYDWNVVHKLYRGELLRTACIDLPDNQRIIQSEDICIYLLISAYAHSYRSLADSAWYVYNLGRGVTLHSSHSIPAFCNLSQQSLLVCQFLESYASSEQLTPRRSEALRRTCTRMRDHLVAHTMNDWNDNVSTADKPEALDSAVSDWGATSVVGELYRFLRDAAYDARVHCMSNDNIFHRDLNAIDFLTHAINNLNRQNAFYDSQHSNTMRRLAEEQLNSLNNTRRLQKQHQNHPIAIFISTHKSIDFPRNASVIPVQTGAVTADFRFADVNHDDEGENISAKNPMYCELTTQYWAWKNIDAEYYGFCHYRRYFDFSDTEHAENPYGEIMDDYIDADAIREYGLDDETIARAVQGYDVITTRYGDLTKIIDAHGTPKKVWEAAPKLLDEDLHRMYDILCAMHPEYRQDAIAFLNGNRSCFCNMFIMHKEIFHDYCAWLFPMIEVFERNTDMSRYSKEALRTPGHLAERLLNIYLMHHQRIGSGWKTKELQCVHFTNPEPQETLAPLDANITDPIVPVVFAADDNYVPQLATTIYSAMVNASQDRHYDVVVLQRNIAWDKQERLRTFFRRFGNMTLRFINVDRLVSGVELTTNNAHISVETYYRFLIQQVLPFYDKVLYLDSDIIINGDIAELYDTELGENLLAAVHDIDFLGNLNVKHGLRMGYAADVLHMQNPYDYFQAGVLVLNTRAMREHYTMDQWLEYASNPEYIYNDQDVLNAHCEGKVTFLDWSWNVMHDCAGRVENVFSLAPNDAYDAYMASREQPKIIHYAGFVKPWTDPDCDFASIYWRYARETPFYERLLKKVAQSTAPQPKAPSAQHERAIGEGNALRKVIDPLMPIGSKRREAAKAVGRLIRGKH